MAEQHSLSTGTGVDAQSLIDQLADLYEEVYAEPPYNSGPLYRREEFESRTLRQAGRDGFAIVWAWDPEGQLSGFSFGIPFEEGRWWSGSATEPPKALLEARKFAVIELVVRKTSRNIGLGRLLIDSLLSNRSEPFAILTADPDAPARDVYRHWGWTKTGTAQHSPDAPVMDQLMLPLPRLADRP